MKRTVEETILKVSRSFPAIVVYGPRQVGKSTTIEMLFASKYRKVTLDDRDDRLLAESNPRLFLESHAYPLIIDEIQKAPSILDEIKIKIDEQRLIWIKESKERELMYILTGSSRFELQEGISESLAGRCGVVDMSSFSQAEKYGYDNPFFEPKIESLRLRGKEGRKYRTKAEIFQDIFMGGMPDICTGVSERDVYFKSYINTYIERDVMRLIAASSELQFRNFISILALRTAQELHYDDIARNTGVDARTIKRWISILQTSGIIYLLQPYMTNVSKRIIKAPKLYFMDTGLCAYLCKWPTAEMLEFCAMNGAFFETFVVSEIIKNFYAHNQNPQDKLFYYRDIDKKEIDLLYIEGKSLYPIEIKKSIAPTSPTKNFDVLEKFKLKIEAGLVIETCDKIRAINEKAYAFPVYLL
ncbi:MAG TPA: DUF4143 domain-containing protein [Spirochaetota bacterium]|jgi:hypothetical protein|nr:DUF4143 domain-containing protein [Spirochaetota bacterium]HPY86442.1 DUF4143 domain-containing protein [Spirochaetota bacterium]HQB60965.1 DUF4143 domain-containing protein [Spirochaetota bacterium]